MTNQADRGGVGGAAISNAAGKRMRKKALYELPGSSCWEGGDTGGSTVQISHQDSERMSGSLVKNTTLSRCASAVGGGIVYTKQIPIAPTTAILAVGKLPTFVGDTTARLYPFELRPSFKILPFGSNRSLSATLCEAYTDGTSKATWPRQRDFRSFGYADCQDEG